MRIFALASLVFLLVAAKPAPQPSTLAVATPVPTFGQEIVFAYHADIKPYEYTYIWVECDNGWRDYVTPDRSVLQPRMFLGSVFSNGEWVQQYTGPATCTADMSAAGGNRTHPGVDRHLAGPITFVGQ